jgi:hypothetical protein
MQYNQQVGSYGEQMANFERMAALDLSALCQSAAM